ncbi:MAG: transaldolase, partial [Candidatus Omnitrophica bacterium]|nr:transaldolase [Candidatus Omnitrophota bacterium]
MNKTTIEQLAEFGQSVWVDNISRAMFETGSLEAMIASGLRGMTSNPSIFNKSVSRSTDYDARIGELCRQEMSVAQV